MIPPHPKYDGTSSLERMALLATVLAGMSGGDACLASAIWVRSTGRALGLPDPLAKQQHPPNLDVLSWGRDSLPCEVLRNSGARFKNSQDSDVLCHPLSSSSARKSEGNRGGTHA